MTTNVESISLNLDGPPESEIDRAEWGRVEPRTTRSVPRGRIRAGARCPDRRSTGHAAARGVAERALACAVLRRPDRLHPSDRQPVRRPDQLSVGLPGP